MEIFSRRVNNLRKSHSFTQDELADKLKITRRQISSYENAKAYPTVAGLIDLAAALDTTTDYLLGLTDNPLRDPSHVSQLSPTDQELVDLILSADESLKRKLLVTLRLFLE